jgi:hypothetical protein
VRASRAAIVPQTIPKPAVDGKRADAPGRPANPHQQTESDPFRPNGRLAQLGFPSQRVAGSSPVVRSKKALEIAAGTEARGERALDAGVAGGEVR